MTWKPLLLIALAFALLPTAQAVTITGPSETLELDVEGSGAIAFTVSATCDEFADAGILGAGGTMSVTVTATDVPTWLSTNSTSVDLNGQECLTGGEPTSGISANGSLPVSANATAPGGTPVEIGLDANDGEDNTTAKVSVAYAPGYTFIYDQTAFPMDVTGDGASFNITLHLFANARSMAMFQVLEKPEFLTVSGLPDFKTVGDEDLAGDKQFMIDYPITVTPPETGTWEEDKIVFKTWSHFLDDGNVKTDDMTIEWTFVNTEDSPSGDDDDSNGIPGLGGFATAIALLGAALVAARRRS